MYRISSLRDAWVKGEKFTVINLTCFPFKLGEPSFQDPRRSPTCLLTKTLERFWSRKSSMEATQVLLHPGLTTISSERPGKVARSEGELNTPHSSIRCVLQRRVVVDWSPICPNFLFPKRPPRVAEQIQATYPDHGDQLQEAPQAPLRNQKPKNHLVPKGPQ
jgi:hypothetical protein